MNRYKYAKCLTTVLLSTAIILPCAGQDKDGAKKDGKAEPSESEMMATMMELAKPGDNHKLLARGVGSWTASIKMWMSPGAPALESTGNTVTRETMGGRYFISEHSGKMQMPGPDGKMMDVDFKGMAIDGYDNVKKKFVASWIDSMGTSITLLEGTYDAATKSLTYLAELEPMPGMKMKVREVIKIREKDHHTMEWYEDRGGAEVKTMEIAYTRKS